MNRMLEVGDSVRAVDGNMKGMSGVVVGFYKHTESPIVRTEVGHEWIMKECNLEKIGSIGANGSATDF